VLHAVAPLFVGLIALEWLVARGTGRRVYVWRDSVVDLGCGMLSQFAGVFMAVIGLGAYQVVAVHAAMQHYMPVPAWPDVALSRPGRRQPPGSRCSSWWTSGSTGSIARRTG
jgi:hypothetical protein